MSLPSRMFFPGVPRPHPSLTPSPPSLFPPPQSEEDALVAEAPKKRTFRKFSYRGVDLEQLLDMKTEALVDLFRARIRRRFKRGLTRKPMKLVKKLRKAKKEVVGGEKPEAVRTHLRNMVIVPEVRLASPRPA